MRRRGLKPGITIVLGMSDDDNERTAALPEDVHAPPYPLRPDALPLAIRQHGHRGQAHTDDAPRLALDYHRCEENVTDDHVGHRDQRQRVGAGRSQFLDEIGFCGLSEGELVEVSNR